MDLPEDLQSRINLLSGRLEKLKSTSLRGGDEDDEDELDRRHQSCEKKLLKVFRDTCAFVREEIAKQNPHLTEIVEATQKIFDDGVEYAYGDSHLFDFLPSCAHDNAGGQPLILDTTEGALPLPAGFLSNFLQSFGLEDRTKGKPWGPQNLPRVLTEG
ncbi:hypothetical protein FRC10_007846 [Ceratobasidium sp. 414]|nr:hypothetical protein FRC10_007846 [Ceratobasidium sp. 414]